MKNNKRRIIISLSIPVICLLLLAAYKHIKITIGKTITIPVTGYDPRDILSGHYLTYRLDIKTENGCPGNEAGDETVYLCLEKQDDGSVKGNPVEDISDASYYKCDAVIKGKCDYGRFIAGVERFYIPEKHAEYLDSVIRKGKCSLGVKIDSKGNAAIKDLLIDGKSWKEYVRERPE